MRDRLADLGHDTRVVLIAFTDPHRLADYADTNRLPFLALTDPDRAAYRAFGLGRGSIRRVWGRRAARRYIEVLRSEGTAGLARPTEDTLQLGGDFVIAPDGTLTYGFWGVGPDDRPPVNELVAAVSALP